MGTVIERFAAGLGTTNVVSLRPVRSGADSQGDGARRPACRACPAVDFANANFLLSFNANLFETFLSPVRNIYSYGQLRQGRPGIRGKFVQAEPRLSQTAACADEWLPIKPGTEGLLALSIAHVIVEREALRRRLRRPEHGRICRVVGDAWRLRAREDRGADRCAGRVHSARRARVCAAQAERRRRRQPRRRVADGDLCAECAGRRVSDGREEFSSALTRSADRRRVAGSRPPASASKPGAGARSRASAPDILDADQRHGRQPDQGAAGARHKSAVHAARRRTNCGRRSRNVPFIASFASFLDEIVGDGRSDPAEPHHARTVGRRRARAGRRVSRFARSASRSSNLDGIRATRATC